MMEDKDRRDMWKAVGVASGAGFSMLACLALGLYLGYKLDEYLQLHFPASTFMGGIFGAAVGFYSIYEQLVRK